MSPAPGVLDAIAPWSIGFSPSDPQWRAAAAALNDAYKTLGKALHEMQGASLLTEAVADALLTGAGKRRNTHPDFPAYDGYQDYVVRGGKCQAFAKVRPGLAYPGELAELRPSGDVF